MPKVLSTDEQALITSLRVTRYAFAFPGYPCGDPNPYPIHTCVPFDAELNKFVVVIKNLPSPRAKIFWNGQQNQHDYA